MIDASLERATSVEAGPVAPLQISDGREYTHNRVTGGAVTDRDLESAASIAVTDTRSDSAQEWQGRR